MLVEEMMEVHQVLIQDQQVLHQQVEVEEVFQEVHNILVIPEVQGVEQDQIYVVQVEQEILRQQVLHKEIMEEAL